MTDDSMSVKNGYRNVAEAVDLLSERGVVVLNVETETDTESRLIDLSIEACVPMDDPLDSGDEGDAE